MLNMFFLQMRLKLFIHSSTFNKAVFCLGEKQAMLVKYKCSSWYNRVGDFFVIYMEQKESNFIYEWDIIRSQSDQPHSRLHDQWDSVLWWLSVIYLFIYLYNIYKCKHCFHLYITRLRLTSPLTFFVLIQLNQTCV